MAHSEKHGANCAVLFLWKASESESERRKLFDDTSFEGMKKTSV